MRLVSFANVGKTVTVELSVISQIDTVAIERMEIFHPSFTVPTGESAKNGSLLKEDQGDSLMTSFSIRRNTSFKLKGVVSGSFGLHRSRISEVRYLYFLFDGERFVPTDDIRSLIGRQKPGGGTITEDDFKIFNQVESNSVEVQ